MTHEEKKARALASFNRMAGKKVRDRLENVDVDRVVREAENVSMAAGRLLMKVCTV